VLPVCDERAGCAGKAANGITTVQLAYAREGTGHALIAARQSIPREHLQDLVERRVMRLPPDLVFRARGQLATGLTGEVLADGIRLGFACGDEVYGSRTRLRAAVPPNVCLTAARGVRLTCRQAATPHGARRGWEARSGRDRRQRPALVRLGLAGHRPAGALPAHPPPPGHR